MLFKDKLRELRDAAEMSEAKLAKACGVSFSTIHQYGMGLRLPSYVAVVRITKALGVDCTAFQDCDDIASDTPLYPGKTQEAKKPAKPKKAREKRWRD